MADRSLLRSRQRDLAAIVRIRSAIADSAYRALVDAQRAERASQAALSLANAATVASVAAWQTLLGIRPDPLLMQCAASDVVARDAERYMADERVRTALQVRKESENALIARNAEVDVAKDAREANRRKLAIAVDKSRNVIADDRALQNWQTRA